MSSESTDVRLSLRALLKVTAFVAVLAAFAGPLFRQLDSEGQRRLFMVWGVWFAVLTLVVGTETLQRLKAERLAGTVILRLSAFHPRLPQASAARKYFNLISALILGLLMFFVMSVAALNDGLARLPRNMAITVGCYGLLSLTLIASAVKMLWWRGSIRFGEAGILWDRQVLLWDKVTSTDWISPTDLKLHASDHDGIYTTISVHIPPHCRATIDQLLDARITDDLQIMAKSMTETNRTGVNMNHFVVDGDERYAAALRDQLDREKFDLEAKLAEALSDDDRQRIRREIEELVRKNAEALRGIRHSLF